MSHCTVVSSSGWALWEAEPFAGEPQAGLGESPWPTCTAHPRPGPFLLGPPQEGAPQACGLPPLAWEPSSPRKVSVAEGVSFGHWSPGSLLGQQSEFGRTQEGGLTVRRVVQGASCSSGEGQGS